jgi:hypothetical protein
MTPLRMYGLLSEPANVNNFTKFSCYIANRRLSVKGLFPAAGGSGHQFDRAVVATLGPVEKVERAVIASAAR